MTVEKRTQDRGGKNIKGGFEAEGEYHSLQKSKFKKKGFTKSTLGDGEVV